MLDRGERASEGPEKASLPYLPPLVESRDKGILVDLLKVMVEEHKGGNITWDVFSFARSLDNVEKGKADFHMPLVTPDINPIAIRIFSSVRRSLFSRNVNTALIRSAHPRHSL